jgi:hypothetical protein
LSPFGKTPLLESSLDNFYEYNTIIRYLSKKHKERGLTGFLPSQEAKIDQWLDFTTSTLDPILDKLYNESTQKIAFHQLKSIIPMIEKQIDNDGYIVGFYPSNADLVIATGILCPFKNLYFEHLAPIFPKFTNWLLTVSEDFKLDQMHQDFLNFVPITVQQEANAEGTVDREKRVTSGILGLLRKATGIFEENVKKGPEPEAVIFAKSEKKLEILSESEGIDNNDDKNSLNCSHGYGDEIKQQTD